MKSIILSKKLKAILGEKKLNKLGLQIGFAKRLRNIVPFQLIVSVIGALGDKETRHFSEIHRYFNQLRIKMSVIPQTPIPVKTSQANGTQI